MQFTVQYPISAQAYDPALLEPAVMKRFVQAAEAAGFSAVAFTEHPAPSQKWLQSGGHDSFDPLAALAFCAAATERLRLMTYLLVLPYRNPFLTAKSAATVDILSGGRLIMAAGTGYMRSEFAALGVEFTERNALFDEAVEVMRGVWSTDGYAYSGAHFKALSQTQHPKPVQRPHPPLWIGGNSRKSRERVAQYGQGWTPMLIDSGMATTVRTTVMSTPADLKVAVAELRELVKQAGRDPETIDVQVDAQIGTYLDGSTSAAAALAKVDELADAGTTWLSVETPGDTVERAIEAVERFGAEIISVAG